MGIPAFFSYIIKNHPEIIKQIGGNNLFHNFYLDSNSIIYDCLRNIEFDANKKLFEDKLITSVCIKINEYIKLINPINYVFIAFDGVAPVAKLEQQRTRRYKSSFERKLIKTLGKNETDVWDKTAITPGTEFMKKLDLRIKDLKTKFTDHDVLSELYLDILE